MPLYFGARGVTGVEMTVYGPSAAAPQRPLRQLGRNPIAELVRLLGSMRDDERPHPRSRDSPTTCGPPTEAEKRARRRGAPVESRLARELAARPHGGRRAPLAELILRPALNIRGIASGGVGATATNAIPTEARASIDFRLVPDQTPENVRAKVEEHVRRQGFTIVHARPDAGGAPVERRGSCSSCWGAGYPAARTPHGPARPRAP